MRISVRNEAKWYKTEKMKLPVYFETFVQWHLELEYEPRLLTWVEQLEFSQSLRHSR
jgi:hypothetical protein